jgi:hypothetical protein
VNKNDLKGEEKITEEHVQNNQDVRALLTWVRLLKLDSDRLETMSYD